MKKGIIILGVLGTAFSAVFVGISDAPSIVLACYRMILSTIFSVPMVMAEHNNGEQRLRKTDVCLCMLSGVFLGLHFFCYFESLKQTNIASAVVLVDTELIFVSLAGMLILHEKLSVLSWVGIMAAFGGSVIVAAGDMQGGRLVGDLLALGGAVCSTGYTLIGRVCRERMKTGTYTTLVYLSAGIVTAVLAAASHKKLFHYGADAWLAALGLAVFCTMLGHTIFNWGLKYEKASFISAVKLLEPVFASVLGIIFFREVPTATSMLGGGIIITGILICIKTNSGHERLGKHE